MDKIRFAVLLYPHPTPAKGWLSDVICNEGPYSGQGARPYDQAVSAADGALDEMFAGLERQTVEVWTIHTSQQVASDLKLLSPTAMFRRLDALEGDGITVDRQKVRLR
ncbi:hypothetical protein [Actinosynnema pretiosum]|uniref:Uncharacterized protein n=1 Tax=Actinosynnema pretiosum TaxID=42197 RepID=A0A290ZEV1_9PSEU|nr:hypothetical protein [Actinosynnema pretiosum]ATE57493.1 hypothetical protein CNX65_32755 [Actinosynnema pretiosum]